MKKVCFVFGTRPEAIKLIPLILACKANPAWTVSICVTGQHKEMLDTILDAFAVRPDVNLELMVQNQTLAGLTSKAISAIDLYLGAENPDIVILQGDTTTVLCGALAAFYRKIPIGHVEAGLRTGNIMSPWPEEANRVLTTRLAALHFAPTSGNRANLLREGVDPSSIVITGNTGIDMLHLARAKIRSRPVGIEGVPGETLEYFGKSPVVLITGHRRENFGGGLDRICHAVCALAKRYPQVQFVYPVHLNPNVREPVFRILGEGLCDGAAAFEKSEKMAKFRNILLLKPQPYLPFVSLMERSTLIITDSGGIQEEAPSLGKAVLVTRDTTERPEALGRGVVLVGSDVDRIVNEASKVLDASVMISMQADLSNPYGDGFASSRIVGALKCFLDKQQITSCRA